MLPLVNLALADIFVYKWEDTLMGDLAAGRPYLEHTLAIREKALGPDHPDTAQSLNDLGNLCFYEGDLPASASYLRQALRIWEKRLGLNHPDSQTAKDNLAFFVVEFLFYPRLGRMWPQPYKHSIIYP